MFKFRNRKNKYIIHNRTINRIVLRLQNRGTKTYPVWNIVVIKKNNRSSGRALTKLGVFNPTFTDRFLFLNSDMLYYWLKRGLFVHRSAKRYLVKMLHHKVFK